MKLYCDNYFSETHEKINMSKDISCCLGLLIEKYDESELFSLQNYYAGFFVRTINHYLKLVDYNILNENSFFEKDSEINKKMLDKLINIIIQYSFILIQHNKNDFAKIVLLVAIDLTNFSKYKYEKSIIKQKVFLFNNLSFNYLSEKRFFKAKLFIDKCKEINKSSLDKIIIYNNCCVIYIKRLKEKNKKYEKETVNQIVNSIIYYLHLQLKELKKRMIIKYKDYLKKGKEQVDSKEKEKFLRKKELTCFLLYNCLYIMKFFDLKEFNQNYNNCLKIIQKLLSKKHNIYIKMIRINGNKENNENIKNEEETNDEIFSSFDEYSD